MSTIDYSHDSRVVLTLDAGGTNFRFSAVRANKPITQTLTVPSFGNDLNSCLFTIVEGFARVKNLYSITPVAISFAFPGPADYPNGIIGDLPNLPGFRGGIALGPMLEEKFGIPVFINNDGDLFTYGEAIAGFLPYVNTLLEKAGSPKRYKNLLGVTLGTGFGGGIVRDGELFLGDNSMAGEIWLLRNKIYPLMNAEESVSIRAVRRTYAQLMNIPLNEAPDPAEIQQFAFGAEPDKRNAAIEAYRQLGEVAGDAIGNALTLIDGLAVIGGGISKAYQLFLPTLVDQLNSSYIVPQERVLRRLASVAFNLEDEAQLKTFLEGDLREVKVPGSFRKIKYDPLQRIGIGISRLGTSEAIAIGAYAFALNKLTDESFLLPAYTENNSTGTTIKNDEK